MCDTLVALGAATADGVTLFAKNSDREPDEVQNLEVHPAWRAEAGERKLTHLGLARPAGARARTLLSRPFWMFGAEMGANEHGVVIGNEALFTRERPDPVGLTGMDLLRLALEETASARDARDLIIDLLERHGQGGDCGWRLKANNMNGFIIADRAEAYVLETVKSWWAWKKIADVWSISNAISLTDDFDRCSPGLIANAVKKGWAKSESDFDFRRCYSDRLKSWGSAGLERCDRSRRLLSARRGQLTVLDLFAALRDHGPDPAWTPERFRPSTLCMHAGDVLFRRSQCTGSLVCRLSAQGDAHFATGSGSPCQSPFFPVFSNRADLPQGYRPGGKEYDPDSYWWRRERDHRAARDRFGGAVNAARGLIAEYEREMASAVVGEGGDLSQERMDELFGRASAIGDEWASRLPGLAPEPTGIVHRLYWAAYNKINKVPGSAHAVAKKTADEGG